MDTQLQSENFSLRQELEALLLEARRNEEKMRRFDQLERCLIGAGSLAELLRLLLSEYKKAFGVERVTLALHDPGCEISRFLETDGARGGGNDLMLLPSLDHLAAIYGDARPKLGPFDPTRHDALFCSSEHSIASLALLPITRQNQLIGGLHFGSADPERYVAGFGTDFLERLAAIIGVCLESALNQERLKLVGLTDALTGVQNRRYFEHRCQIEISQARRHEHPLACMFLDIDRFKRINDTWGHQSGDEVLRTVASLIQGQLRAGDTIARFGGEEFVALLPQAATHHAIEVAERIRCCIERHTFKTPSGQIIPVTLSIGLSMLPRGTAEHPHAAQADQLVATADQALYRAKESGRNRVVSGVQVQASRQPGHAAPAPWWAGLPALLTSLFKRLDAMRRDSRPVFR